MLSPIHRKSPIGFRLIYLALPHSKCEGQGHLQFDSEEFDNNESHWISSYVSVYAALSCHYSPSIGITTNAVLGDLDLEFQGQSFETLKTRKR